MKYVAIFAFALSLFGATATAPPVQAKTLILCRPGTHWIPGHWVHEGKLRRWVKGHCG
jgi:hypothetical protein